MKILKIIGFIFLIYFVRRFIHMYRVMKRIHEEQMQNTKNQNNSEPRETSRTPKNVKIVDADFKVLD